MSHVIRVVSFAAAAALLAACGDAGDHFGEFRQNPVGTPPPQQTSVGIAVTKMSIALPQSISDLGSGYSPVLVTAYDSNGNVISGNYSKPILVSSNNPCTVEFAFYNNTTTYWTSVSVTGTSVPISVIYNYNSGNAGCPAVLPVVITASDADAKTSATYTF